MRADGTLDWTPPAGDWVVLRMGYSLLGITNHPASPEGTGLEVDKLNPAHVKAYMDTYLDNYKSAVGPLMGARGLQFLISDSWEAGAQNWTDDMIAEFTKRRGYDIHSPGCPRSPDASWKARQARDRFLWDFRRTLSDMLAEYHYDQITTLLKARGMGHYGESHEGRPGLHRRRHGGEAHERRAHVRHVDAASGRNDGAARLQRRHPRIRVGGAHLRAEPRRRGVADRRFRRLGLVAATLKPTADKSWRWASTAS